MEWPESSRRLSIRESTSLPITGWRLLKEVNAPGQQHDVNQNNSPPERIHDPRRASPNRYGCSGGVAARGADEQRANGSPILTILGEPKNKPDREQSCSEKSITQDDRRLSGNSVDASNKLRDDQRIPMRTQSRVPL